MARKKFNVLSFIAWLTGIIVSLAVGFAMTTNGPLNSIPFAHPIITSVAGWIVIVTTILSVVLVTINALSK